MNCPFCRHDDTRVTDSRTIDEGQGVRRRRVCPACEKRFTTLETTALFITKRSGVREAFSREKVIKGVRKACHGRPVSEDQLARLGESVEDDLRSRGLPEVSSHDVGVAVLEPLSQLDEVAYLRFASVYQNFVNLADFELAISELRARHTSGLSPST